MIPCSGTIKASDISVELGRNANYNFRIGNTEERQLAGKPSGLIKFSDFACKSNGFDLNIGYMSGFNEQYLGFMNVGGLERADTGSIKGQFPSPYFDVGTINNSVGFYFHALAYMSRPGGLQIQCNANSAQGYLTNPVLPWGENPVVKLTDSSGNILTVNMYRSNKVYNSDSPDGSVIRDWLMARRYTNIKVSITS